MRKQITLNKTIIISLILFFIVSIITIYSCLNYVSISSKNIFYKQVIFYFMGFSLIFLISKINTEKLIKYSFYIYITNIIFLLVVLILGKETNGSKAWIYLPLIGGFQPSEFMKIGLILFLASSINKDITNKSDSFIIFKSFIIFLIPTILTFLEPDTGAVIVYFIITLIMLFVSGIKKRWFILLLIGSIAILGSIFYLYYYKSNLFINLLGSNFFYRLDRILDWTTSSGLQLKNSLISVSSSGFLGHGFNNILIYYPELQTDFIFASYVSCFGLLGAFLLFILFIIFDFQLLNNNSKLIYKLISTSIFGVFLYQQIQNTAMTIGILPITGITLPLISYGGSSLISFMILIGIILNIKKKEKANN